MQIAVATSCIMLVGGLCLAGETNSPTDKPGATLEKRLKSIIIPSIEFYGANINDVVSDISRAAKDHDKAKQGVHIVLLDRDNQADINIERKKISLYDVLKLVSKATGIPLAFQGQTIILAKPQKKE